MSYTPTFGMGQMEIVELVVGCNSLNVDLNDSKTLYIILGFLTLSLLCTQNLLTVCPQFWGVS